MGRAWGAEVEVGPERALELIRAQCPGVEGKKISLLGSGWDNTAYLVDDKWVFRFPRRKIAVPLLMNEVRALPKLKEHLPLAIPDMQWIGKGDGDWPFAGYPLLAGITACRARLSDEERKWAARPLGQFLRALHKIPIKIGEDCGLLDDTDEKLNIEKRIPKIKANFEELIELKLLRKEEIDKLRPILEVEYRSPKMSAIVHGDFYARHVLVDADHKVSAVIDWGDVHLGDPAVDLAIAHSFLPPDAHEAFRDAYGKIEERTWLLARLRALYSGSLLMVYGHHIKDEAIFEEGRRSLLYLGL
jgi:aminoglycoside phosphotransferase (APT) family kinase protein